MNPHHEQIIFLDRFSPRPWQMMIAVLILLSMPVNYRGGAELSHPHAFFQFWGSHGDEAFDHHHSSRSHSHQNNPINTPPVGVQSDTPVLIDLASVSEHADSLAIIIATTVIGLVAGIRVQKYNLIQTPLIGRVLRPTAPPPR